MMHVVRYARQLKLASTLALLAILASSAAQALAQTPTPSSTPTPAGSVTISSPANGAVVSGTVNFVTSKGGTVSWINYYIDGIFKVSSPPYTFVWDSTKVANGNHTFRADGKNSSGVVVASASITVNVANSSTTPTATTTATAASTSTTTPTTTSTPTATFTSTATPTATSTVTSTGTLTPTQTATPTVTATSTVTATPTDSLTPTQIATPTSTATATSTATPTLTPTPTLSATATATSTLTPTSTSTPTPTPTPLVAITSPANGATVSGTVSIVVTIVKPPVSWVNLYIDNNFIASSPPLTFSWNTTTATNGTHTIRIDGKNSSGTVVASASISAIVANATSTATPTSTSIPTSTSTSASTSTATSTSTSTSASTSTPTPTATPTPLVAITSPANGATVSGTVSIVATTVKPPVSWVNFYIDNNFLASSPPLTLSWDTTTVINGAHTIRVDGKSSSGTVIASASISVISTNDPTTLNTTTPIKRLIIIVGENHSFDNVFAGYVPPSGQSVMNLLSEGIITPSGGQGPNYGLAVQQQATNTDTYSLSPTRTGPYSTLPPPNTTYATGTTHWVPDPRFPANLSNGPYQISQYVPYTTTDFVGDPVHRFFQMYQQMAEGFMDLFVWTAVTTDNGPNSAPTPSPGNTFQGSLSMGYYNISAGDAQHIQSMATNYAIADNYHQAMIGPSGPAITWITRGDAIYYVDSNGNPAVPPANQIEDPDPQSGTNNFYASDGLLGGSFVNCSDLSQPGVAPIMSYLNSLSYSLFRGGNCAPNTYYLVNNTPSGGPPLSNTKTLRSFLIGKGISVKYYGTELGLGINANQIFTDIANNALPSVSIVGPEVADQGHPAYSSLLAYENFVTNLANSVISNSSLFANTAIVVTVDESGGYYDTGYVQPIDFFGDGPRIPAIVISPYAKQGFVDHTYYDHSSLHKFIEANWLLSPLSSRTRDNLPNPIPSSANPYVPVNPPAIGDLMNMFDFSSFRSDAPPIQ
jgi:phospholipase C